MCRVLSERSGLPRVSDRIFVLGGTRSGKSRYGRERAHALGGPHVTFLATARPGDPELDARIAAHRAERPSEWQTVEAECDLASAIRSAAPKNVLLIDSITLWVATTLEQSRPASALWPDVEAALGARAAAVVIVSDEVGLGIVPIDAGVRAFRDELGTIHQRTAAWANEVWFLVAGIPTRLKGD
jgi:adenosylcobinamide kinase/adenosylcobinamide-phosphate guanylyltransferase